MEAVKCRNCRNGGAVQASFSEVWLDEVGGEEPPPAAADAQPPVRIQLRKIGTHIKPKPKENQWKKFQTSLKTLKNHAIATRTYVQGSTDSTQQDTDIVTYKGPHHNLQDFKGVIAYYCIVIRYSRTYKYIKCYKIQLLLQVVARRLWIVWVVIILIFDSRTGKSLGNVDAVGSSMILVRWRQSRLIHTYRTVVARVWREWKENGAKGT